MKLWLAFGFVLAYACLKTSAFDGEDFSPPTPRHSGLCSFERLSRSWGISDWYPQCYGFFGNQWLPQQCDTRGRCWCVWTYNGQPIYLAPHASGEIDCFQTQSVCNVTRNEVYSRCSSSCDATCDEPDRPCATSCGETNAFSCFVQSTCRHACGCRNGCVRDEDGICVPLEDCPAPECPENQVFAMCGGCDVPCEERDLPSPCPAICVPKCTCERGLYLDGERCVPIDQCPPVCNASLNEVYRSCAPPCDATCTEPRKECSLQESCNRRCACAEGQMRNSDNVCVDILECDCPENQVFAMCGGCDVPCEERDLPSPCPAICVPKCTCERGLYLDGERCVPIDQCPPVCNASLNEVYRSCAPPCDATCTEPSKECSLQESCNRRCACAEGQLRNSDNVCVESLECDCPENLVFLPCAGCDRRCDERNLIIPCFLNCNRKCACPAGMLLNGARCVTEEECPAIPICNDSLNEVFHPCAPPCDATCNEPMKPCNMERSCNRRCACANGQIRNKDNVCVDSNACTATDRCPANQIYSSCAGCDRFCDQRNILLLCTLQCRSQCTCDAGMYLDGDRCVPVEECPPVPVCDALIGEVFSTCAPPCDASCDDPEVSCSLEETCTRRCACPGGMIRNGDNACVRPSQCTSEDARDINLNECASQRISNLSREATECDEDGNFLTMQCLGDNCFCVNKYTGVVLQGTRRPIAIFDLDCDFLGNCPGNMTYSPCATMCPSTCSNPEPRCTKGCALDCNCPPGSVRLSDEDVTCVPIEACPTPHTCDYIRATDSSSQLFQCDDAGRFEPTQCNGTDICWCVDGAGVMIENTAADEDTFVDDSICLEARLCSVASESEEFSFCAPPCDATCAELDRPCSLEEICTPRCACAVGHVRGPSGECIPFEDCPEEIPPPPPPCRSDLGEVFSTCAPSCDASCEFPLIPCSFTKICEQRCACPTGYLRADDNRCIPAEQCPGGRTLGLVTACLRRRADLELQQLQDAFIPECHSDTGKFEKKQCYGFLLECWCVDPDSGVELDGTRAPQFNPKYSIDCQNFVPTVSGRGFSGAGPEAPPIPDTEA